MDLSLILCNAYRVRMRDSGSTNIYTAYIKAIENRSIYFRNIGEEIRSHL